MRFLNRLRQKLRNFQWFLRPEGFRAWLENDLQTTHRDISARLKAIESRLGALETLHYQSARVLGHDMQLDPRDSVITRRLREQGVFEPFETDQLLGNIKPGDVVLDVGANIGYYTLLMARQCSPGGWVYAFEPDPDNATLLRQNVRQNGYENVTVIEKAIGDRSQTLKLYRNADNLGDHRTYDCDSNRDCVSVESTSIDDFVESIGKQVNFIKFDIQGYEGQAFKGMRRLLASHVPLTLFMEFWPRGLTLAETDPIALLDQIRSFGFSVQVIDEQTRTLNPANGDDLLKRYPLEYDTDIYFTNLICTRESQSSKKAG